MQPTHPSITDLASVPQSQRPQQHLGSLQTGDHNMSSMDAHEMLAQLFDTSHANIAWAVRNGAKYPDNFNMEKNSQHLAPCAALLTSIETSFQTVYSDAQNAKTTLDETQQQCDPIDP